MAKCVQCKREESVATMYPVHQEGMHKDDALNMEMMQYCASCLVELDNEEDVLPEDLEAAEDSLAEHLELRF